MGVEHGEHTYVGDCQEYMHPSVKIGRYCSLAGGVFFHGASNHSMDRISTYPFCEMLSWPGFEGTNPPARGITIGNDVWVGHRVTFLDGVVVEDGVVIGAESVVRGRCEAYGIYVGNPAILIRKRFDAATIAALLRIKWWDWPDIAVKEEFPRYKTVEEFVKAHDHA